MAIKGQIYDVTQSRVFFGPGGPYAMCAGKDASRAFAKMSFEDKDLNDDLTGLNAFELETLQDWEYKFMGKQVKVGTIKSTIPITDVSKPAEDGPIEKMKGGQKVFVSEETVSDLGKKMTSHSANDTKTNKRPAEAEKEHLEKEKVSKTGKDLGAEYKEMVKMASVNKEYFTAIMDKLMELHEEFRSLRAELGRKDADAACDCVDYEWEELFK